MIHSGTHAQCEIGGARLPRVMDRARSPSVELPSAPRAAAPIVKWAGGKTRVLRHLLAYMPAWAASMRHVEPFAGGAALFFARAPKRAILADINPALMDLYAVVRDSLDELIVELARLAAPHDEAHYYRVRERYNEERGVRDVRQAARFLYLNRTCFNGLHRVNRRGEFNVPVGRYTRPRILDAPALHRARELLSKTELRSDCFEGTLASVGANDFVYLDPPYEPRSRTASFTAYTESGFGPGDQRRLRDVFDELTRRGVACMLSNSDTAQMRALYRRYRLESIDAPRSLSSSARTRGVVRELVVRNYV